MTQKFPSKMHTYTQQNTQTRLFKSTIPSSPKLKTSQIPSTMRVSELYQLISQTEYLAKEVRPKGLESVHTI